MFKRLFFLSGIIAFLLAAFTMWFWYLPTHSDQNGKMNQLPEDSVTVQDTIPISE